MRGKTGLQPSDFVHLHNHTHYSVLDGLQKIPQMLDRIVELGMDSVALTDHGTLSGAIEFYKGCKERNLRPIIGIETYVANRKHTDKDPSTDRSRYHLILLAMNNKGYENLMRLSSIANLDGFYFKPRIDHELLGKYNEGLIVLSGCIGGEIGENFRYEQDAEAKRLAEWYVSVFGDRFYLEVQDHGHSWDEQKRVNEKVLQLGKELNIPVVVTSDAHYCRHEDQEAHEILLCVQTGSYLSDTDRFSLKDTDLFVTEPESIVKRWGAEYPEVITNTKKLAERCEVKLELGGILIPKFETPKGFTEKSFLNELTYQGLAWRYGGVSYEQSLELSIKDAKKALAPDIVERAEYELGVIDSMGFNGYFLIVQDFINWGKNQGIIFGPGRGSAAGSIVAYSLRITEIEPLKFNLMFERFLNPSRVSMPDIDIDIQDTRRGEVIQYCVDKYGSDRVAYIVTFGKMAARNSVRDVARVLQVPYAEADRLAKMIPPPVQGRHIPLEKSLVENNELKQEYNSNPTSKKVFDLAVRLEGTVRSHGVHAAGVVIAPDELVKYAPLEMAQKGVVATQYSMGPIEDIGILKFDFLGLSNLTIIKDTLRIVKKVYKQNIELSEIPIDDKKTFELLKHADTTGVFQLESSGMKRYLKELKPTEFSDIIAIGALYRPGPMAEIPRFIEGKHNPGKVRYLHESLEPILRDTYGVMVYQEQIIKLLQLVAGYTPGEADLVRKAIGKKKRDIMEAEEPKFIEGCIKQGLSESDAKSLWAQIQPFADYSFNKAHATCYAQISYWTAYLKAHYPAAFMAALMTNDYDDIDRLSIDITECRHMGIEVLPPDVNESFHEFAVVVDSEHKQATDKIRFGLDAVKNVGRGAVEEIINARSEERFTDVFDFAKRVNVRTVNRKNWESLIKSGAMDSFGERGALLASLDQILQIAARRQKEVLSSQADLFGDSGEHIATMDMTTYSVVDAEPSTQRERLQWERELLGLYLSDHPLKEYDSYLLEHSVPIRDITVEHDGKSADIGGLITDIRSITTKNGQSMAFIKIEDNFGEIEGIVFPSVLKDYQGALQRDYVILAKGRISGTDKSGAKLVEPKYLIESLQLLGDEHTDYKPKGKSVTIKEKKQRKSPYTSRSNYTESSAQIASLDEPRESKLYVRIADTSQADLLVALKNQLETSEGNTEVVLVMGADRDKQAIRLPHRVLVDETTVRGIAEIVGAGNVIVK